MATEKGYRLTALETAYCGLFGASAILLPLLFHLLHVGRMFMPMYIPLVSLAFFVRPLPAAVTSLVTPLISGAVTGMPPFFPPVAAFMSLELAAMSAMIAFASRRWPSAGKRMILVPVLIAGRVINLGLVYLFSLMIDLPPAFMAGVSLLSGWPGLLLMTAVVPYIVRAGNPAARRGTAGSERI